MYPDPLSLLKEEDECTKECKITRIECFRFDCELSDKLQPGHGTDCHCGLLTISTNLGTYGLGEFMIPCCNLKGDFVQWAAVFQRIKGLTLTDGLHYVHQKQEAWGEVRTHLIESALTDLSEKLEHPSASNEQLSFLGDRNYLFDHSQAYISF
ncbi:hypothetical protein SAMN04487897_102888 [Paenibacillus sp. yr247]|uniref:hypothetical protein n=1 Tax=Paenibacillus sp. yr247 TaxID=1761880 RepID=UPI00088FE3B1|nr:hypothetical protein [Paenibacillus sp. yr247]SDN42966.1 hypothetical protein SAMN04487897_102888 [Paenibacillus sp. yr247]